MAQGGGTRVERVEKAVERLRKLIKFYIIIFIVFIVSSSLNNAVAYDFSKKIKCFSSCRYECSVNKGHCVQKCWNKYEKAPFSLKGCLDRCRIEESYCVGFCYKKCGLYDEYKKGFLGK